MSDGSMRKTVHGIDGSDPVSRERVVSIRIMRRTAPMMLGAVVFALVGCSASTAKPIAGSVASQASTAVATPLVSRTVAEAPNPPLGAQPQLAADPAQVADDLVADERALRDPSTTEPALVAAARREQAAYRAIGRHPEWDSITAPRIPPELVDLYDRNLDARRQLQAMTPAKDTLPAWRIEPRCPPTS